MPASPPAPVSPAGLAVLAAAVRPVLLMLDYDGTLVPIAPAPQEARPDRELLELLEMLSSRRAGLITAVVSGRGSAELAALLPLPRLVLVAGHGACWRPPGGSSFVPLMEDGAAGEREKATLAALARALAAAETGLLVEEKDASVALHYRLADPAAAQRVRRAFLEGARPLLRSGRWRLLRGKKVLEITAAAVDKGRAVALLLARLGGRPVYLGDDTTDEDAFKALKEAGLTVLVSRRRRPSAARFQLASVEQVRRFLFALARRLDQN